MSQTRSLTPEERSAFRSRTTWIARAVALAFAAVGGVSFGLMIVVAVVAPGGSTVGEMALAGSGVCAICGGTGAAIGALLYALGKAGRDALSSGPLHRGTGVVREVRRPGPDGGSTVVLLDLSLPEGSSQAIGQIRVHNPVVADEGDTWVLWFDASSRYFFPDQPIGNFDPGTVKRRA